ncbi:MAG: NAD-dependent epimerase/dehydratase family protein [Edaphobacter sp.]
MRIFITGASGFVGGAFLSAASDKHLLFAMSRGETSDKKIIEAGATPIRCSLDDVTAEHMVGMEAIVHAAAYVEQWGTPHDFWHTNVEGTKRLLAEARKAGVRRFVHIGTEAVLLRGQALINVDETYPLALNSPFPYSHTKAHAEIAVREANDPANRFESIVLRPRFVWGPGDERLLPGLRRMNAANQFVWVDGGRHKTSTTYIGNLIYAMELALTQGRGGEAYFVLDEGGAVSFRDFLPKLASASGFELKGHDVPGWLVRAIAFVAEKAYRFKLLRQTPPITRFSANVFSRDCVLVDAKARREMGYVPPISRESGLSALTTSLPTVSL